MTSSTAVILAFIISIRTMILLMAMSMKNQQQCKTLHPNCKKCRWITRRKLKNFFFDNKDMLPLRSNKLDYTSRNEEGIFVRCSAYHSPLKSKKGPRLICGLIYLFYTINCFWVRTFVRHRDGWHILDSLSTNLTIVHTYKSADILHTVHTLKWKGREKYNDWQKVWHEWQNCDASRRVKSSHILWGDKVKISLWVGSRNSILL